MNKVFYIMVLLLLSVALPFMGYSQQIGDNVLINKASSENVTGFNPKVRVSLGSSFASFAPGVNTFGSWIMPELSAPVTKKLSVSAGMGYSAFFAGGGAESVMFGNAPQHYGTVYVKGDYRINEKISISAMGYKTFNLSRQPRQEKINPHALDMSNEGVMINLNYKVTDKFEINAAFSYDKRNYNPYYYNGGMMNPGFHNPAMGMGGFGGFYPGF